MYVFGVVLLCSCEMYWVGNTNSKIACDSKEECPSIHTLYTNTHTVQTQTATVNDSHIHTRILTLTHSTYPQIACDSQGACPSTQYHTHTIHQHTHCTDTHHYRKRYTHTHTHTLYVPTDCMWFTRDVSQHAVSRFKDLTLLCSTPRLRWMPACEC
jgi:hypothetical protein